MPRNLPILLSVMVQVLLSAMHGPKDTSKESPHSTGNSLLVEGGIPVLDFLAKLSKGKVQQACGMQSDMAVEEEWEIGRDDEKTTIAFCNQSQSEEDIRDLDDLGESNREIHHHGKVTIITANNNTLGSRICNDNEDSEDYGSSRINQLEKRQRKILSSEVRDTKTRQAFDGRFDPRSRKERVADALKELEEQCAHAPKWDTDDLRFDPSADAAAAHGFPDLNDVLCVRLMKHQLHAIRWAAWRERRFPFRHPDKIAGAAAADDDHDGLSRGGHTLIVAPASVLLQWRKELEERCKAGVLKVLMYYGAQKCEDLNSIGNADVVITSYETLNRDSA
eukprot:jgi/Bigna1/70768/fgenesh1_pg.13_\